ncbi:MAG: Spy/CpxP family protein refolding chaperone [Candidatus Eisenbacteria bacterium]|nr:Spy/CpxP family protein refolding chaperone [Candidatus Eisenbacteria bacterium]
MRPRMMMWRRAHGAGCCGEGRVHPDHHHFSDPGWEGGGPFGVRRPLRFLAWKLGLDDPQIAELAAILDTLKTERAQAAVDERRALSAFADVMAAERFDPGEAGEAAGIRAKSAERVQQQVVRALERIHALLTPEQRSRFAYLIRSGALGL